MVQSKFFESVVEPSIERLGIFGFAHDINFDGRHFVVTHKISKNVFTEFDTRLSRYLAAVTGSGLPAASVETWIRDMETTRTWNPYPARHVASVPHAMATAVRLALGSEEEMTVRLGDWIGDDAGLEMEQILNVDLANALEKALDICRLLGTAPFLDMSGDLERVLVRPIEGGLDMMVMDVERGTVSVPTTSELPGIAYQGPLFGLEAQIRETPVVAKYLSRARHAIAAAKEKAIHQFREAAETRILEFDAALSGRDLSGYRLQSARTLVARLQAGLGDTLLGLSEAAQLTALDWATSVRELQGTKQLEEDDPSGSPNRPRLVR